MRKLLLRGNVVSVCQWLSNVLASEEVGYVCVNSNGVLLVYRWNMGVGLQPLEFSDCLTDSPYFREKLHTHEKELERTSQQIKGLVKEVKDLLSAAKRKL
jgi:hypothetical protein